MSTSTGAYADIGRVHTGHWLTRAGLPQADRPIAQAILLSLVLHAALLLAVRVSGPQSDALSLFPELVLRIETEAGNAPEHDDPPPVPDGAETRSQPSEQLVDADAVPQRSTDAPMTPQGTDPLPVVSHDGAAESVVLESAAPSPLAAPESELSVVTTTGPSHRTEPPPVELEPREARYVAMPTPEQEELTRRIMQGVETLEATDAPQLRLSWQEGERIYAATLTRQPATDGMDIDRVTVEIESEEYGKKLRTRAQVRRLAFSHFTQLIDRWDRDVQLHDDVITGRFHSNSEIVLAYDRKIAPLFLGKVTTAARSFSFGENIGRRRKDDIFPQGIETRAEKIRFPERLLPAELGHGAQNAQIHSIEGDAHITFYSDGSFGVRPEGSKEREDRHPDPRRPTYIIGGSNSTLYVRGIVRGKVLVYSPLRIVIEDDVTYARDPRVTDSDDYLGLVSERYVEVASPRMTGPGDLHIQAAVYAKRRFDVTYTQSRRAGTLYIYGSLTAGTLSETEPRYATTIEFDPRFERLRPPGFPQTNQYEIETWEPHWEEIGRGGES